MKRRTRIFAKLVFYSAITFSACNKQNNPPPFIISVNPAPMNIKTISYLALGDSYTIGQSLAEKERFPYLVSQMLNNSGFVVNNLRYIAQTGWSTIALQNAITNAEPLDSFDMVTLLIGVNDQYQGLDTAGYRVRFTQLLEKAVSLAKGSSNHVFVLSIPDYSATPFVSEPYKEKVRKEIDDFNAINKQITLEHNVSYTNITDLSREVISDPSLLASDGLHYSAEEHYRWAERLMQSILPAFK